MLSLIRLYEYIFIFVFEQQGTKQTDILFSAWLNFWKYTTHYENILQKRCPMHRSVCQMMTLLETVLQQIRQLPNNNIFKRKANPETAILVLVVMEQTLAPPKAHKNCSEILFLNLRQICRFPLLLQKIWKLFQKKPSNYHQLFLIRKNGRESKGIHDP